MVGTQAAHLGLDETNFLTLYLLCEMGLTFVKINLLDDVKKPKDSVLFLIGDVKILSFEKYKNVGKLIKLSSPSKQCRS